MHDAVRGSRLGAAAGLLACACAAWSVELTEQEAVARALARPEYAQIEAARVDAARGAVWEASRLANPVLTLEHERFPASGGSSTERTVGIAQSFDLFGRRSLRVAAAEQRVEVARHEVRDRRLQAIAEVRRAFAEALSLEREQQVLAEWLRRIEAAGATVTHLARSGEVAGYARRRIEREVQAARARAAAVAGEAARARERLRGLAGPDGTEALRPVGELMPPELPPLSTVLAGARERPDLAALLAQARAFDRERAAAERAWAPDLTLGVGQKRVEELLRSDTGLVLSLAFPLPLFDRGEGRRDSAAAQARSLRAEHSLLASRREAEIRGRWQQAAELRAGALELREGVLAPREGAVALRAAPAGDLARTAEIAYRAGEGGILELLDAYRSELEAELSALDLELRARLARIELDVLSGADHGN